MLHLQFLGANSALILLLLVAIICSALVALVPWLRQPRRLLLLSVLATAFVYRSALLGFVLTHATVYLFTVTLARLTRDRPTGKKLRWQLSCLAMSLLAVMFLVGRWLQLDARSFSIGTVQLFYFSLNVWVFLRLFTFLWEFGAARFDQPRLLHYGIWCCLPFTLSGPLLRFSQFAPQWPEVFTWSKPKARFSKQWGSKLLMAASALALGIGLSVGQEYAQPANVSKGWKLFVLFGFAPWGFYLTWAGFFLFMECLAIFWGLTLPPSFNRPFGRPNLSEFWANWNMTATAVFRDYFFYNRWGLRKANLYVNVLLVFLMVGLWHDANLYWLLWGLLHGIGFCLFMWYRANRKRALLRPLSFVERDLVGSVLTYIFVCLCWYLPSKILTLAKL